MRRAWLLATAVALCACDPSGGTPHDHDHEHEPGADAAHAGPHVHTAPHGGTLVVLDEEVLNVELLADPTEGSLTLWVLDGECENPVRIAQPEVELTLTVGTTAHALRLDAVGDALTGETPGDTSQFFARADALRGASRFEGTIRSLVVGTRAFQSVPFRYSREPR